MTVYKDQILKRLDVLSNVSINGERIGEINPTSAARAAGQKKRLLLMLINSKIDPRLSTLEKAAETLGIDVHAIVNPNADMGDLTRWPPPGWIKDIFKIKVNFGERRLARINAAMEIGRPTGLCSDCKKEDALIGEKNLCGACYQRARRSRLATSHQD